MSNAILAISLILIQYVRLAKIIVQIVVIHKLVLPANQMLSNTSIMIVWFNVHKDTMEIFFPRHVNYAIQNVLIVMDQVNLIVNHAWIIRK